jgi:transcriptional regulator with GAF, ATPase, and Fis domain/tetratricopeptide (TPR) repeat protein
VRRISAGAGGEVFLAQDQVTGSRHAVKVLPVQVRPDSINQLHAEFAQLTELAHPGVVRVYDAGVSSVGGWAGRPFVVMAFVDGATLAETLAAYSAPAERFKQFALAAEALADALAYLHGRGVVHGDISPANVRCGADGKPILIDFGLARRRADALANANGAVSGTLGFLAPEALLGERGPAGDLFALGATLYDAWSGSPPFGLGLESVQRVWQGLPPTPSSLHPGLTTGWDRLLLRLLAPAVEDRPSSARELLQEIRRETSGPAVSVEADLSIPFPAGDPLAGVVVGRKHEEQALFRHLELLSEGAACASVVAIVGSSGSGRKTLVRRALRQARLAILSQSIPVFDIEERSCSDLLAAVAGRIDAASSFQESAGKSQERLAQLIAALEQRSLAHPLCLVLGGSPEDEALAAAVAWNPPTRRLLVVIPCQHAPEREGCVAIPLGPLSRESVAELAQRGAGVVPPETVLNYLLAASAGTAGVVSVLVRGWIRNVREGKAHEPSGMDGDLDLDRVLDASFSALSQAARFFVTGVALSSSRAKSMLTTEVAGTVAEREALAAGWVTSDGTCDIPALPSSRHLEALWRAVARDENLKGVARQALPGLADDAGRLAEVHDVLGDNARAAADFWQAMREAHGAAAWNRVVYLGRRARAASQDSGTQEEHLLLANALGILGRYDEALALLNAAAAPETPQATARLAERKAWLLGRRGDPDAARRILDQAISQIPADSEDSLLLRARLARMLVSSGHFAEALAVAQPAMEARSGAGFAATESAILALAFAGRIADAGSLLASLKPESGDDNGRSLLGRAHALTGLVLQLEGRPLQAAEAYRKAVDDYEQARDLHGIAAATFNLGCTLAEIGNYTGAIAALERSIRDLGRLGAVTDHALAVFNVGQLFLQLGEVEAVARAIRQLEDDARASSIETLRAYGVLLTAELQRKRRALKDSLASYASAAEAFARLGMQPMVELARLGRADCLVMEGKFADARAILGQITADTGSERAQAGALSSSAELLLLARARLALADVETNHDEGTALAQSLLLHADTAKLLGRRPMAWRMASLAAAWFSRRDDARAGSALWLSQTIFQEMKMNTPAKYWSGLASEAEIPLLERHLGEGKGPGDGHDRAVLLEGRLRRLLRINKRLNSELRLSRVLETIIDTVIELTDAERGFLLLKDGNGELVVKVARNIDQTSLEGPDFVLSRSIAKQAADSGEPVMTVDAAGDRRFSEHLSVSDLHLRSVLAVPLLVKGNVVGTLYVDHRLRKGVFGDDELAMVMDFAEQGAIAIENARLVSELRRREQQVQSLNRRLERELRVQEAALSHVRVELKESRQAAALRYDYREIVGRSPSMLDLFRLLDRVTDTGLPVVIEGESGTGKELVARAIHFNGPRKDRAFVSENCAAIPETLLESTLFGHVRGSFTGAERETRGLFSIADRGTLFLDEVAEMSPAMQGKLLRVLQEGEFHRVGGERSEKVDVRILVATNKNLIQLVEEGKFRKDLFYRLSVVRLHLPPLRERREDIPLLVRHFLEKAARPTSAAAKNVEPAAMAKLCGYAWPGNVRELENEIARAGAFAGAAVSIADLSSHIQAGQDPSEAAGSEPDSLRLRQRVERVERLLIREAMNRVQGNQTKASLLLGLSRFGLQKKLRRYNLGS